MVESVVQSHAEIVVDSTEKPKIRVLHVDDELGLLKVAKQCLELQGPFHVDTAGSAEEALNKLKEKEYDAVVSDYQMPGKDGLEFLEMLRKNGNTIPFIMFTGKGREEVAVKAWSLGADHYVNKTGDPETVYCELAHSIRQTVEKKKAFEMRSVCQQRFLCLVENAAAGVGIFDPQGRFTYVNDALANLLGYPARELAGRHFSDFLHKEDKARILESFRQISELGIEPPPLEFRAVRKDGRLAYLMAKPTKSEIDGKIVGSQAIIVDITERKKMEQDLVDNQERLQRIFSASPDAITLSDINGNIVECNQATLDILELSSKEELIGKSGFEFIPEKDHQRVRENLRRTLEQGSVKNVAYTFLTKSGREISTDLSSSVLKDSSGKIVGFVSVAKDVTAHKKAEEGVLAERDRLETVTRSIGAGLAIISKDYRTLWANDVLKQIFGDVEGKICYSAYNQRNGICPECGVYEIFETGKAKVVHEQVGKDVDGKTVWSEITATPVKDRDGNITAVLELVVPITQRKRAEEELRENEERFRNIVESSQDVIMLTQPDGIISYLSPACSQVLGYEPAELVGKQPWIFHPDDLEKVKAVHYDALKGGKGSNLEYRVITKTGETRWISHSWSPIIADNKVKLIVSVVRDITERKKIEEALRKSEAKCRSLVEQSTQGIVIAQGPIPHMVFANSAMSKILGYTVEELTSLSPQQTTGLVHPDDRELFFGRYKDRLEGKHAPAQYEVRGIRKDGTIVWLELASARIEYEGQPAVQAIFTDITESEKTEQTLKESEEKYRDLVELAPDGIVAVNVEGIITSANSSFLTLVGYDSAEEIVGKPFTELKTMRREDIPKFQEMFKSLMKGESPSPVEFLYVRKDGTSRWAEVHPGLMTKDGYPVGVQAIMRDVSERKNAEKLVQESHQRFDGLFRHNPEAAVYLDVNFKILDMNPRFCQLFGYSAEELKGENIDAVVVPESLRGEAESLDKDAKNGYASHNTVRKRKDGSLVPVSISAAPVTFENRLLGYVGIYKDITDLKDAEEHLKETNKKLEDTNEKLQVVGGLTRHDVRNKLSTITGNIYINKKKLADHPGVLESFKDMESACEQIVRIFEFARDYERLGVEELSFVDVETTVGKIVGFFSDLKGVRIVNECHGLAVLADSLLERLFFNLIDNSIKYGEKLAQIRIRYEKAEDRLQLIYEDDGVGISKDAKPRIFNEGFTTGKGSGYGLYLIKRMMDVYGWTISETGTHGKGAQFIIVIPEKNQDGKENYQLH